MHAPVDTLDLPQHFVFSGVSWDYYERTLVEVDSLSARVTFLDGVMELMSPLPEHDSVKSAISYLIGVLVVQRRIPMKAYGSTTFRRKEKAAGAEPDGCFYFQEIDSVKGMKRFDPKVHRAPDLWIEVDLVNTSVPREPIYARLGVPEIWRYRDERLIVRRVNETGQYVDSATSQLLPFLPISEFTSFIHKMMAGDETSVMVEFQEWVRRLPA